MAVGFLQSLYALDAADGGERRRGEIVVNALVQALLGYIPLPAFQPSVIWSTASTREAG